MSFNAHSQIVRVLDAWWKGNVSVVFPQIELVVIDESGNGPCSWGYNSETLRAQL